MIAPQALSDCETVSSGLLAQPVNAISSLGLVAAGLWLFVRVRGWPARAMAVALVVAGVGSFAYHGPQPSWSGPVHDAGVVLVGVSGVIVVLLGLATGRLRSLAVPGLVLGTALFFDLGGRTGGFLCLPDSLLQAHAAWHCLAAVGMAMLTARVAAARSEIRASLRPEPVESDA
ncbi:MAG TPA: hypothetical protein VK960_00865 [Acidimicrobiia bacterium]|nr:hypothetical protein [Acidimicrobiia bacterium]